MAADLRKIEKLKKAKPFALADIFLYAAIVLAVVVLFVVLTSSKGGTVTVYYMGEEFGTYTVTDRRQEIEVDGHMVVIIQNNKCWIEDADCPDKVCMARKIQYYNETLICLPNNIVVKITNADDIGIGVG